MAKDEISPSFRWLESSKVSSKPDSMGYIEYEQLEITIAGKTEIIKIHDSVLLRSDDNPKNDKGRGNTVETFVARIEKMWEEPKDVNTSTDSANTSKEGKEGEGEKIDEYSQERTLCMKIRARWYFKKKDMQNMRGTFLFPGINRRNFINSLTPQVLILGEQSDDNEVATILSKCKVLQCRPENTSTVLEANKGKANVFVCSHTVYMPKQEEEGFGTVLIHPFDGDDHYTMKDIATPVIFHDEQEASSTKERKNRAKVSELDKKRKRTAQDIDEINTDSSNYQHKDKTQENEELQKKKAKLDINTETAVMSKETTMKEKGDEIKNAKTDIDMEEKGAMQKDDPDAKKKELSDPFKNISSPSKASSIERKEEIADITTSIADNQTANEENKNEVSNSKSNKSESSSSEDDETTISLSQKSKSSKSNRNPPPSPKITAKEGAIHVGPNHQASIPPMPTGSLSSRMTNRTINNKIEDSGKQPTPIWLPNSVSDDIYNQYLSEAATILKKFMNENDIESDGVNASSILMGALGDGREIELLKAEKSSSPTKIVKQTERKTRLLTRECNEDKLIATLHDASYDLPSAIKRIKDDPIAYLTVWSSNEKESFNNGFRRYRGSLRSISKGVSSKTYKDIVDYHYRFKIPMQFRKYQEKKREQAKRMMGVMDFKTEYSSGRKSRSWSKVGAHEQRQSAAKDFLIQVRDTIGSENYLLLATHLKMYQSRNQTISVLKENVTPLLHSNTSLLEKFLDFLPKKYRA